MSETNNYCAARAYAELRNLSAHLAKAMGRVSEALQDYEGEEMPDDVWESVVAVTSHPRLAEILRRKEYVCSPSIF